MSEVDANSTPAQAAATGAVAAVLAVFLNRDVIVDHYKTVAEAINSNERVRQLLGDGRATVVTKKKTGFTRQLLIGPLDAAPFEYDTRDWEIATQKFDHLPDLMAKRHSRLFVVVGEDTGLLTGVLQTLYKHSGQALTDRDVKLIAEAARRDLRMGDVCIYNRSGYSEDNPSGMFEIIFSLTGH